MIVNSDKFQVILPDKCSCDNTDMEVEIGNEKIKSTSPVKFLGVHIDRSFDHHINRLFIISWSKSRRTFCSKMLIVLANSVPKAR